MRRPPLQKKKQINQFVASGHIYHGQLKHPHWCFHLFGLIRPQNCAWLTSPRLSWGLLPLFREELISQISENTCEDVQACNKRAEKQQTAESLLSGQTVPSKSQQGESNSTAWCTHNTSISQGCKNCSRLCHMYKVEADCVDAQYTQNHYKNLFSCFSWDEMWAY